MDGYMSEVVSVWILVWTSEVKVEKPYLPPPPKDFMVNG